eukprot:gene2587-3340_t
MENSVLIDNSTTYYGDTLTLQTAVETTRARAQPGGAKLAVPKPVNLPSIKKEHAGNDPATQLVPAGSTAGGWKTDEQQQQPPQASHPAKTQPPPSTALANEPKVAITAGIVARPNETGWKTSGTLEGHPQWRLEVVLLFLLTLDTKLQNRSSGAIRFPVNAIDLIAMCNGKYSAEESSFPGSRMFAESARPPPLPPGPPPREREEKEKSEVDLEREAYKAEVASVFRQQEEEREQKRLAEEKLVEDELEDAESPTELPSKTGDQPQLVGKTRLAGKMMPRSERALAERKAYEDEEFRRKQSAAIKLKELEERIQRSKKEAEEKRQEQAAAEEALQEESPGAEVEVEVGKSSFGTVSDSRNASDASREEAKEIPPTLADADWAGNTSVALSPTTVQLSPSVPVVEDVLPPSHVLAGSHPAAEETILSESAALPPEPTPAWSGMPGLLEKPSAPGQAATSSWGVLPPTQGELSSSAAPMSEQPTLPNMAPGLGPLFTMGGEAIPPLVFTTGGILDQNALEEDNLPLGLTLGPVPIGLGSVRPPVGPPGTPAVSFMTMPPGMPKPHPSHPQAAGMLQDRSTWPGPAPVFGNGLNSMVPPMVTGMPAQQMLPVSMAPTLPGGPYGVGVPTAPGTFRSADQPSQICDVMQPPSAGHPVVAMPSLGQSITVPSIAADANGGAAPGSADSQALESGAKFTQGGALPSTNNKRGGLRRGREQEDKESSKRGGSAAGPAGLNKDRQQDRRAAKDEGSGEELGTGKGSKGGRGTGRAVPAVKEVTASAGSAVGKGEGAGGKGRKGEGAAKGGSGRKGKGSAEGLADGSIGATKGGRGEGKRLVYRIKQESGSAEDVDGEESTKLEYREGGQDDFIEVRSKKSVQSEKREQLKQTVPEAKKAGKGRREEALSDAEVAPAMNDKKGKPRAPRSTATDALLEQPAVVSDSTLAAMAAASAASAGFPGMSVRMAPPGVAQQQPDAVSKAVAHAWGGGPREYNSVPSLAQIQREELTKLTHTEIGGTVDMLPATLETPPDKKSGEQGKGSPGEGLPSGIFNNAGLPADGIGLPTDLSLGDLTHAPPQCPAANEGSREVVPLVVAVVLPLDEEEEATWEMAQLAGVALVAGEEGRVLLTEMNCTRHALSLALLHPILWSLLVYIQRLNEKKNVYYQILRFSACTMTF